MNAAEVVPFRSRLLGAVGAFLAVVGYAKYDLGMNVSFFPIPSEGYAIACTILGALMMLMSFVLIFRNVHRMITQARAKAPTGVSGDDPRRTNG
jgi:hypothetical protein